MVSKVLLRVIRRIVTSYHVTLVQGVNITKVAAYDIIKFVMTI